MRIHNTFATPAAQRAFLAFVRSDISEETALAIFAADSIQGEFLPDDSFRGYDYREQAWIDTANTSGHI